MQGLVPSNYLQEIEEYQEDDRQAHVGQSNRGVVRPIPQRDRNRGHGPGARGPPPPPRDGMPPRSDVRDRRKGIHLFILYYSYCLSFFSYRIFKYVHFSFFCVDNVRVFWFKTE